MGASIAFMTALHLKEKHKLEPMHLFVSSATPPHVSNFIFLRVSGEEEGNEGEITMLFPYMVNSGPAWG